MQYFLPLIKSAVIQGAVSNALGNDLRSITVQGNTLSLLSGLEVMLSRHL